jgi:hypothetical protein
MFDVVIFVILIALKNVKPRSIAWGYIADKCVRFARPPITGP